MCTPALARGTTRTSLLSGSGGVSDLHHGSIRTSTQRTSTQHTSSAHCSSSVHTDSVVFEGLVQTDSDLKQMLRLDEAMFEGIVEELLLGQVGSWRCSATWSVGR